MEQSKVPSEIASFWGSEALRNTLTWPDEHLVRFLGTRFPDRIANEQKRAVEIGCGNGRNLTALVRQGLQTVGVEISQEAAMKCRHLLNDAGVDATVFTGDFREVLRRDDSFSCVVWDSPCLLARTELAEGLACALALLTAGGEIWTRFRHPDTWFAGLGREIDDGTQILDGRAREYAGAMYSFLDGNEAEEALRQAGFVVIGRERVELWKRRESERHVWTIFWAEKPR